MVISLSTSSHNSEQIGSFNFCVHKHIIKKKSN